jgi:hypothetical protein
MMRRLREVAEEKARVVSETEAVPAAPVRTLEEFDLARPRLIPVLKRRARLLT